MTIEQTVEIPADYRLFLELPRSVPSGIKANVKINIPVITPKIVEIRKLLQKEMAQQGTTAIKAASGDGWETHVKEHYAKS